MKSEGKGAFIEMLPFYTKDNVFFIPECARWNYLMEQSGVLKLTRFEVGVLKIVLKHFYYDIIVK